jgi:hypothetical protein
MRRLAIQNSLKCMRSLQIFIHPHCYFILDTGLILWSIELFIYIQICVIHCCNLIWGLANNNYSLYFLQFLMGTVAIYVCAIFSFPSYIVILYIVGPLSKLTETSFFCWRLHKYDLLQFVVMDHSTVIFQKEKGGGGKYITYKKNHWYARLQ